MFAQQMLATVVGWDLYLSTRSPVVLGNVGLVQIIPVLLFTFVAGHVADRYNRSRTAMVTQVAQALVAFALAAAREAGAASGSFMQPCFSPLRRARFNGRRHRPCFRRRFLPKT